MRINRRAVGIVVGVCGVCALSGGAIASAGSTAAKSKKTIRSVPRSHKGANDLAHAIFQGNQKNLLSGRFVTVPTSHDPVAISTKSLAGFPRRGNAFAILSTGCAKFADDPNDSDSTSCRDGGILYRGARDVTMWRIHVKVPSNDNCLSFRFRFLSDEYPEFVGSQYNDAFLAEIDRTNWGASDITTPAITAPENFATTADGGFVSVNASGVGRVSKARARGTTYDAATRVLRASTPVKPGRNHYLYLTIFDQGDRQYDSAVFIDQLTVNRRSNCKSGLAGTV